MKIKTNVKAGLEVSVKATSSVKFETSSTVDVSVKV
jgi:hypothetical protein